MKSDEPCHLISTQSETEPHGAMYILFKNLKKCCKLGPYSMGFGPLRPDFLQVDDATFAGQTQVGSQVCNTWAAPHPGDWFTMVSDDWSVLPDGTPCAYQDHFKTWAHLAGMRHNLTFNVASYSEDDESDEVFSLPDGMICEETCPNKAGKWCTAR